MNILTRRFGTGSLLDLANNPLVEWTARRARRDPRSVGFAVIYLIAVHGVTAIALTLMAAPGFGLKWREFSFFVHFLTWAANAFLFGLWVPTRFAQALGTERERKTLDFLRMTRIPARKICIGALVSAYMVPVAVSLTSIPEILVGCMSEDVGYVLGVVEGYTGLVSTSLIATTFAGLISFIPKKGNQAAGGAFLILIVLLSAGGAFQAPFFEPLGCLGPWGGLVSEVKDGRVPFVVKLCGEKLPGVILQFPLAVALAHIFLTGTTRRIESETTGFLGLSAGLKLGVLVTLVLAVTFSTSPASHEGYYWSQIEPGGPMAGRFMILLLALFPLAADTAIHREEVVRGLARAPEPPDADEQVAPWRSVFALTLPCILLASLITFGVEPVYAVPAFVAAAVTASTLVVVHFTFQVSRLYFSQPVRGVMANFVLGGFFFLPLLGAWGTGLLPLPAWVKEIPTMLCPFVAIFTAATARDRSGVAASGIDPIALSFVALLVNVLAAFGLHALIRELMGRAREFAATLTVLPADAFAPAGKLNKKCANGHLFSEMWEKCPHCPAT
ncbi:MAG TPA: hypothetical protein VFF73_16150 [Planctomycetota bacterium]|nr:hypothetical protein [Planctomycetota bacterium]